MGASWLALLLAARVIGFDADWAVFRAGPDSGRVEFAFGIPYDELSYVPVDGEARAAFTVGLEIRGLDNDFRETGTVRKQARLHSFDEALAAHRTFVDQFSVVAPAGRHEFALTVADSAGRGVFTDTLDVPRFGSSMAISGLQVGVDVLADTVSGNYAVVPNPARRFGAGNRDRVYVYFEVYGLVPDSGVCTLVCTVLGPAGDTVVRGQPLVKRKSRTTLATALGVSVDGLRPGAYELRVTATDPADGRSAAGSARFSVAAALAGAEPVPPQHAFTEQEKRYYDKLEFVATVAERDYYRALSDSGKQAYLAWFWKRHDLGEFVRRMDVAEQRYGRARTAGVKTDRGRIYVKYGEPDAVEQRVHEMDVKPREYWHYYRLGYAFVFVDLRGDGNFRLAYANSPDEQDTGLEQYLTAEEQEQFH